MHVIEEETIQICNWLYYSEAFTCLIIHMTPFSLHFGCDAPKLLSSASSL